MADLGPIKTITLRNISLMTLLKDVKERCAAAFIAAFDPNKYPEAFPNGEVTIEITPATNRKFGHYQCNSAMKLTKLLEAPPRAVAEAVCKQLNDEPMFAKVEVAGPGFINITLSNVYLSTGVNELTTDSERLGCRKTEQAKKVVIDFSSPNIAKEMHVGHLRSTIIGDAIARVLEFCGHEVKRINHVGDWGTQFGMLITYLTEQGADIQSMNLPDLVTAYKQSKIQFDNDPEFKQESQQAVVELQAGNPKIREMWEATCKISRIAFEEVYKILDINLQERGESFYNDKLPQVIEDLSTKNLIQESDGAKCIFIPGFTNREGEPLPLIVQKGDGGYNYATTDIAALKYRLQQEQFTESNGANWLIYVTDSGQSQHFSMVFAACQLAKYYSPADARVDHVPFGLVLRTDGKKFKTRDGETFRLIDLLHTAQEKAYEKLSAREHDSLSTDDLESMAKTLGINAVKYADLACNRISDYTFSFDRMLQFEGNTAAFICYAYVRVQSIKRKVGVNISDIKDSITIETPEEIELALLLLQFPDVITGFTDDLLPNRLTEYLYNVAEQFHAFFHNCRVGGTDQQNSRLLLCEVVATVLAKGMQLLGLKPLEKM